MARRAQLACGAAVAAACLATSAPAAQYGQPLDRYEMQYGTPVDVTLHDLAQGAVSYRGRAIRTKGRLEISTQRSTMGRFYALSELGASVLITPMRELGGLLDDVGMQLMGHEVEVTGVYQELSASDPTAITQQASGVISFWKLLGPPEKPTKSVLDAAGLLSLESLLTDARRQEGRTVKVIGKFRGRNLYGDLPVRSQRDSDDWVIKDDLYAVWVTDRKPKGDGFALDAGLKRDTNKWLEVVGRVSVRAGVVYLQAVHVALTSEPRPAAEAKAPPPPPEKPKLPPVVVFALPLDGEQEVARASRFFVQFSKDMNESTFKGRVVLRYAGPVLPGDRGFDGLRLGYDGGRRALEVDPGDNLMPGRTVELLLLSGIADLDGLELTPRAGQGQETGEAVDVLRYRVGS